jgi:hypothetical protein
MLACPRRLNVRSRTAGSREDLSTKEHWCNRSAGSLDFAQRAFAEASSGDSAEKAVPGRMLINNANETALRRRIILPVVLCLDGLIIRRISSIPLYTPDGGVNLS